MLEELVDVLPEDHMEQVLSLLQGKPHGLVTVSEDGQLKGIINLDNTIELLRIQSAMEGKSADSSQLRM